MNESFLLPVFVVLIMVTIGCTEIASDDIDVEDRIVGKKIKGSDGGSGYMEEQQSEVVFTLSLTETEHLTGMTVIVDWSDEPPVQSTNLYYNEGEQFRATISDDDNIKKMGSHTNPPQQNGHLTVFLDGIIVDNQTTPQPRSYAVEIKLLNSGDQYPYAYPSETLSVEDTGNDYSWTVWYEYVDKSR